jgi:ribokinase
MAEDGCARVGAQKRPALMIHVIGNAAVDSVIRVERFAHPGETIVALGAADYLGGKGANQAVAAARCGARVRLVAAIGADQSGDLIRAMLEEDGIATEGLRNSAHGTDRCVIMVDRDGENMIVSLIAATLSFDPVAEAGIEASICAGDWIMMQGNLHAPVTMRCLAIAKSRGATTVLNPSPAYPPEGYDWSLVDVAVVNRSEAVALGGSDPFTGALALIKKGAGAVVLTLAAEGSVVIAGHETWRVSAPKVVAVDTVGAGDALCGTLVAARAQGLDWSRALSAATQAAAISVTRAGALASFPSRAEVKSILERVLVNRDLEPIG